MPNHLLMEFGYANGYVAVPSSSPLFELGYGYISHAIDIARPLTYSGHLPVIGDAEYINEGDSIDDPEEWWCFGFHTINLSDGHCDRDWCIRTTLSLKEQLEKLEEKMKQEEK